MELTQTTVFNNSNSWEHRAGRNTHVAQLTKKLGTELTINEQLNEGIT